LLGGNECILSVRGVRPFLSTKYDITKHPRYKMLADYNKKNTYVLKDAEQRKMDRFFESLKNMPAIEGISSFENVKLEDFINVEQFEADMKEFISNMDNSNSND
jgi:hypothetical protein